MKYRNPKNAKTVAAFWEKPLNKPDWYEVKASADGPTEIFLYDVIGWPYNDARELVARMSELRGQDVLLRINSPGGDVFDGLAIFAEAAENPNLTIRIESLAASMASGIAMASKNKVQMYSSAMMMIHEPWMCMGGNQHDFREAADFLDQVNENLIGLYAGKTKKGKKELRELMKAETWMNAEKAKAEGFIDEIIKPGDKKPAKAAFNLSVFNNLPDELRGSGVPTVRDAERALRDVGFSQAEAKAIVAGGYKAEKDAALAASLAKLTNIIKGGSHV